MGVNQHGTHPPESCLRTGKTCLYPLPDPPLRERRALCQPGQLPPWLLSANQAQPITFMNPALDHNPVDPFDCLPVHMPYKSKQLLHYFLRIRDHSASTLDAKAAVALPILVQDQVSLRNTMLIAGLHHVWTSRDVRSFNATVLFHRTETIQSLNEQLRNPQIINVLTLVKHIVTLCFTDLALGNMVSASTHLDGLVTILDHFYSADLMPKSQMGLEEELMNRYLILVSHLVLSLKTRMQQCEMLLKLTGQALTSELYEYATLLFYWHSKDIGDLERQLKTISLYPFFFAAPSAAAKFRHVDAAPILEWIASLTNSAQVVEGQDNQDSTDDSAWAWIQLVISRLHFTLVESHVTSLYGSNKPPIGNDRTMYTSWLSITAAAGLYVHSVLGLWNSGNPINPRLFRYIMAMLLRDLGRPENYLHSVPSTDFWFWKHFVCAFSLAWHQERVYNDRLQWVEIFFDNSLRSWSQLSGVVRWEEAQERLEQFAWPMGRSQPLARGVWERAIGTTHK